MRSDTHDPRRILVVDDDDEIRELLCEVLVGAGYAAETACNGREALRRLKEGSPEPDVVVLDLEMPVLDGGALYRMMRQDDELASIPVVVSTGMPSAAPKGAPVLPKPVDVPALLTAIAQLCHRAAASARGR